MNIAPTPQHVQAFGRAIAAYLSTRCHKLKSFQWPIAEKCVQVAIRRGLLPGIPFGGGFAETMQLRQAVAARAREIQAQAQLSQRLEPLAELASFVIADWGNLNGNDPKTILGYAERFTGIDVLFDQIRAPADLQAAVPPRRRHELFRFAGIASWSKWLNFVWNDWALIYDSRIAFALDAVHFICKVNAPVFPVPAGRNPLLTHLNAQSCAAFAWLASYAGARPSRDQMSAWMANAVAPEKDAYVYYLAVMAEAHRLLWPTNESRPLVHTEMLLFMLSIEDIAHDFARELLVRLAPSEAEP